MSKRSQRGTATIFIPISIFLISCIGLFISIIYTNTSLTTDYVLFNGVIIILFAWSLYSYYYEKADYKHYYYITYWILALIFLANFIRELILLSLLGA